MENEAAFICLQPTYRGIIASAEDALILVEACLRGYVSCVSRRPFGEENAQVIRSGNIFIYEENASGIKRWVDGLSWGWGRQLNGCSLYRQVNSTAAEPKNSPTSIEAKRATLEIWEDIYANNNDLFPTDSNTTRREKPVKPDYTENGLVKKRMSFTVGSMTHRLVSYYSAADALEQGKLQLPSKDPKFAGLIIRQELLEQYDKIPFGNHGRQDKDRFNTMGNAGMPALDPMGDTGVPTLSPYGPMGDTGVPALDLYNPIGDAGMPALDPYNPMGLPALNLYNPMGNASMPALDYDTMTGNGEDQGFEMPSRFSQPPDPNSEFMEASNQQGPPPTKHPFM